MQICGAQTGSALGGVANADYPGQIVSAKPIEVSRTIASAIGRIDGVNDRLAKTREVLTGIADQIGGLRPTSGEATGKDRPPSSGAVGKLHDSTEFAHAYLSDIENLLGSIGRALG